METYHRNDYPTTSDGKSIVTRIKTGISYKKKVTELEGSSREVYSYYISKKIPSKVSEAKISEEFYYLFSE